MPVDLSKSLVIGNGLDEKRALEHIAQIREVDRRMEGRIRVFAGIEVDILADGALDLDNEVLARMDVVVASIHSRFEQSREEMTARVLRAMRNPHADILFHPTARILGKREPVDLDLDAVIACARETGTVLELDAYPSRLDLRDDHVRKAVAAGVKLVIDSDAHATAHLDYPERYGIDQARRGWATRDDVLNTRAVKPFLRALKGGAAKKRAR